MTIFLIMLILIFILITVPLLIIYFIGLWKLFKKAGYQGWESLIPLYNKWILIKISKLHDWYFPLMIASTICSLLNITSLYSICWPISLVATFFCYYNISKKLHQDMFFTVLLFLFPIIVIPIIGLSKKYNFDDTIILSPNGPIEKNEN